MAMPLTHLLAQARRLAVPAESDADLLARFVSDRDEAAFASLVARHGPMVLQLCRRLLFDAHVAEDAFQATFLVLARKAGSIGRPATLAGWLYGVAYRVALKARCAERRRPRTSAHEVHDAPDPGRDPLSELTARELLTVLEEELHRLPETYRMAVVCCCLESLTVAEAAQRLGCTTGALRGRLERGRARLHARLVQRGLTLSVALAAAEIVRGMAVAGLAASAVKTALAFGSASDVSVANEAARLACEVLPGVGWAKLKITLVLTIALGLTALAVGALSKAPTAKPPDAVPLQVATQVPEPPEKQPRRDLHGDPLSSGALTRLGTLRFRNSDGSDSHAVSSLDYTPDGRLLVSSSRGAAVVWDATTGKVIRRLGVELPQPFGAASLSSDGKLLAVGGWGPDKDTAGAVYEIATGRRLYRFGTMGSQNSFGRFSPDGAVLAVYGLNNAIQLHDAPTGKRLRSLGGHKVASGHVTVADVAFTPDSKVLISAGADGTIRLWDLAAGTEKRQIATDAPGHRLTLSADGKLIAFQGWVTAKGKEGQLFTVLDRQLRLLDALSGKELRQIAVPAALGPEGIRIGPHCVSFTSDGKGLLTSGTDGVLRHWDIHTGRELRRVTDDDTYACAIAFAPNGKTFAIAEIGNALAVRDLATGRELVRLDGHRRPVRILAVSPNGRTVATAAEEEPVFLIWDVTTGKPVRQLKGFEGRVRFLAFSPDGSTLFAAGYDNLLMAWDTVNGRTLYRRLGHKDGPVWAAAVSPDGKLLAWAGEEKAILLLDAATGKELRRFEGLGRILEFLAFSPDSGTLLGWTSNERLHSWNLSSGQRHDKSCKGLAASLYSTAFSPDLRFAAFAGQRDAVVIVNLTTGAEFVRIAAISNENNDSVNCTAFSPDGRTLAWAGPKDGIVRLTETATGKERRRLIGHRGRVNSLAFSGDGKVLVSGGDDTTCLIWEIPGSFGSASGRSAALNTAALSEYWESLKSEDAAKAYVALRRLIADPARAVPYLGLRLRPAAAADARRVARLLMELDSEEFAARDRAARALEKIGEVALPALRQVLAGKPSLEMRRRVELLVDKVEALDGERLRAIRAVEALERIASHEAQKVLQGLAQGATAARQTQEALAAAQRLGTRTAASP
jgi:RNA polymerase sigma factor (sigma-70 family)